VTGEWFESKGWNANRGLAYGKAIGVLTDMSAGLLSLEETDHFNSGASHYFQHISKLYQQVGAHSCVADFARLALATAAPGSPKVVQEWQDEISSTLFAAELQCSRYVAAYMVLLQFHDGQVRERSAIAWIDTLLGRKSPQRLEAAETVMLLQRLPLNLHPHIAHVLDRRISTLAQKSAERVTTNDSTGGHDCLKIIYALRVQQQDYRGAVSVLADRLTQAKISSQARSDPHATILRHTFLALINALSCVAPDEAYILTTKVSSLPSALREPATKKAVAGMDRSPERGDGDADSKTRRLVTITTLEDLRREYQQLLDRCSRVERGDFEFGGDPVLDDEDEDEDEGNGSDDEEMDDSLIGKEAKARARPRANVAITADVDAMEF
jgi:nuclear pore complex protein Nup160